MTDRRDFAIGILATTATVLLVGVVLLFSQPQARADGTAIVHREYALSVGALTHADDDLVYVINAPRQRLNVYRFDVRRKQIDLVQSLSLQEMRSVSGVPATQPPRGGRRP